MSRPRAPGKKSIAGRSLAALHAFGGIATEREWQAAAQWQKSTARFGQDVVSSLLVSGLVYCKGTSFAISSDGLDYLGIPVEAPVCVPQRLVAPQYRPEWRPLDTKSVTRLSLTRDGALDYRDIPSRVGDHLIAHGRKA